jgi:Thioesterase-like superfamily
VAQTEEQEAFFTREGETLVPSEHARSWWAPGMLHGRLLGGLAADALEREQGAEGLHFARLTVDLFRGAPFGPVHVETVRARDGRRIRVADALVHGPDGVVARASAVLLRRGEQPEGEVLATPPWDVPAPDTFPALREGKRAVWILEGGRRAWIRETRSLVAGEPLSPFARAALAADTSSPLAHGSDTGLRFINADYTLCLSRLPLGDTIGLDAGGHASEEGIAVGQCTVHDTAGPIGFCLTTAVANTRA